MTYDVVIIGGGPGGMTAAIYTARKKLNTLLLSEDIGGQINIALGTEKYVSYQVLDGSELIRKFEEQVKQYPIEKKIGERVTVLSQRNGAFEVKTDRGSVYESATVIIASGKRPRQLNVPGEAEFIGRGVSYCVACDGPLFADMKVAVIGGDNSALEAADDMVKIADHVYLIASRALTGDKILIERLEKSEKVTILEQHEVREVKGDKFVEAIKIIDAASNQEKELSLGGVIVEMGLIPSSDFVKNFLTLNSRGEIEVDCLGTTSVPGVFAAGDVTNIPEKQVVIAAGEGAKAALQANRYLQRLTV
ncbi:MAG TPA: FAD-dependent oxidoreductase [Dehalococcoidia bacterium]|jgi:alkyl hydroperoxide reductase subunit F